MSHGQQRTALAARAVVCLMAASAIHPVSSGDRNPARARGIGNAGVRSSIATPLLLRGGLAGVPASPTLSSRGLAAAQVAELADTMEEVGEALATCAPEDMSSFGTPLAINRALAAMKAVPAATRSSILPALIRNALARVGAWTKGSSIARTLRLLQSCTAQPSEPSDDGALSVDRRGQGKALPTPAEPVVALAHALVSHGVLNAGIRASFSAASVADALASLVALGFQSDGKIGHANRELPAISTHLLTSLTSQAAQAGVASVKEGCDLLWAGAAMKLQSPAIITLVLAFCISV